MSWILVGVPLQTDSVWWVSGGGACVGHGSQGLQDLGWVSGPVGTAPGRWGTEWALSWAEGGPHLAPWCECREPAWPLQILQWNTKHVAVCYIVYMHYQQIVTDGTIISDVCYVCLDFSSKQNYSCWNSLIFLSCGAFQTNKWTCYTDTIKNDYLGWFQVSIGINIMV